MELTLISARGPAFRHRRHSRKHAGNRSAERQYGTTTARQRELTIISAMGPALKHHQGTAENTLTTATQKGKNNNSNNYTKNKAQSRSFTYDSGRASSAKTARQRELTIINTRGPAFNHRQGTADSTEDQHKNKNNNNYTKHKAQRFTYDSGKASSAKTARQRGLTMLSRRDPAFNHRQGTADSTEGQ